MAFLSCVGDADFMIIRVCFKLSIVNELQG